MRYVAIILASFLFPKPSFAADCTKLMQAYESQGKMMSSEQAGMLADNNVYRAIYKTMSVNNLQLSRQMNLTLMMQNKCPLPNDPVWLDEYPLAAIKCLNERVQGNYKAPECVMKNWSKDSAN